MIRSMFVLSLYTNYMPLVVCSMWPVVQMEHTLASASSCFFIIAVFQNRDYYSYLCVLSYIVALCLARDMFFLLLSALLILFSFAVLHSLSVRYSRFSDLSIAIRHIRDALIGKAEQFKSKPRTRSYVCVCACA